jgi:hypothetical protein
MMSFKQCKTWSVLICLKERKPKGSTRSKEKMRLEREMLSK